MMWVCTSSDVTDALECNAKQMPLISEIASRNGSHNNLLWVEVHHLLEAAKVFHQFLICGTMSTHGCCG